MARRTAASAFAVHGAFTVHYTREVLAGEPGFSYEIFRDGKHIAGGWSRGRRREAENDASATVKGLMAGKAA